MGDQGAEAVSGNMEAGVVSIDVPAEDLVALTEGADLTMELEPAGGSRLKGSYWVAGLPALEVTASELGLEETIERLAFIAVAAASDVVKSGRMERERMLPTAYRVLALELQGRLVETLKESEVVSEQYLETVLPPDVAA
jgi:hypothetical protein